MWHKAKEERPKANGVYLVYMDYGEIAALSYTVEGGWNTFVDYRGKLHDDHKVDDGMIAQWFEHPAPEGVAA